MIKSKTFFQKLIKSKASFSFFIFLLGEIIIKSKVLFKKLFESKASFSFFTHGNK